MTSHNTHAPFPNLFPPFLHQMLMTVSSLLTAGGFALAVEGQVITPLPSHDLPCPLPRPTAHPRLVPPRILASSIDALTQGLT